MANLKNNSIEARVESIKAALKLAKEEINLLSEATGEKIRLNAGSKFSTLEKLYNSVDVALDYSCEYK